MAEHHPHLLKNRHDYLPAAGHDLLLPGYDLLTRLLGMGRTYDALVAQADLADGQRVVEIGCGTGNLTMRLKRSRPGADITGTDPDPRALARAQRKVKGMTEIRFERAYAQDLPFADGVFDRALSSMMLHHLDEPTKAAAAAELFRVLKPGGQVHIVDVGGDMSADHHPAARFMKHNPHNAGNLGDALPRLFSSAGFDCAVAGTVPHRLIGRLTFYRAVRREG
ncbi:class I SAM-dependent methyltransferase [Mycobacterium sp. NPDC003449]